MNSKSAQPSCPRCSSPSVNPSTFGRYKCNACSNEFFSGFSSTSTNSINQNQFQTKINVKKPQMVWFGVMIFIFFFFAGFSRVIFSLIDGSGDGPGLFGQEGGSINESWYNNNTWFFEDQIGQPVIIRVGQKDTSYGVDGSEVNVIFYNAHNAEEINTQTLSFNYDWSSDVEFRTFEDGKIYFTLDNSKLYSVDQTNKEVNEISDSFYEGHSEFEPGIAKVEFVYEYNGDGLKITNNEGKEVYFYPLIDQIFDQDAYYEATKGFDSIPQNAPLLSTFEFTSKSFDYPDEQSQLLKIEYKHSLGYPKDSMYFSWRNDFSSGERQLINDSSKEAGRIVSYSDFTPERFYFDPEVHLVNPEIVLFSYKKTPAENTDCFLEALNVQTAEVAWSTKVECNSVSGSNINKIFEHSNGFFVKTYTGDFTLGKQGQIIDEFKYNKWL